MNINENSKLTPEEARSLNNEYMPMYNRIKIIRNTEETVEDETINKMKKIGLKASKEMESKVKNKVYGIVIACGSDADKGIKCGDVVEVPEYAGFVPKTGSLPKSKGHEYQILPDTDITQIKLDNEEYINRFYNIKDGKVT